MDAHAGILVIARGLRSIGIGESDGRVPLWAALRRGERVPLWRSLWPPYRSGGSDRRAAWRVACQLHGPARAAPRLVCVPQSWRAIRSSDSQGNVIEELL